MKPPKKPRIDIPAALATAADALSARKGKRRDSGTIGAANPRNVGQNIPLALPSDRPHPTDFWANLGQAGDNAAMLGSMVPGGQLPAGAWMMARGAAKGNPLEGTLGGLVALTHGAVKAPKSAPPVARAPKPTVERRSFRRVLAELADPSVKAERRALVTDEMTGLGNRRAFEAARPGIDADPNMSWITLDAQRLKAVNTKYGQLGGDALLRRSGDAVHAALKDIPGARGFHVSGDEFAIAVPKGMEQTVMERASSARIPVHADGRLGSAGLVGHVGDTYAAADKGLQGAKAAAKTAEPLTPVLDFLKKVKAAGPDLAGEGGFAKLGKTPPPAPGEGMFSPRFMERNSRGELTNRLHRELSAATKEIKRAAPDAARRTEQNLPLVLSGDQNTVDVMFNAGRAEEGKAFYDAYAPLRDKIRAQHGDRVRLWRAEVNAGDKIPNKNTLFFTTSEKAAKQFGSRVRSEMVPVDRIVGGHFSGGGYHELSVLNPASEGLDPAFHAVAGREVVSTPFPRQSRLGAFLAKLEAAGPRGEGGFVKLGSTRGAPIAPPSVTPQLPITRKQPLTAKSTRETSDLLDRVYNNFKKAEKQGAIERGVAAGAPDWWKADATRQRFYDELGPDRGEAAFREWAKQFAGTSAMSDASSNMARSMFLFPQLEHPSSHALNVLRTEGLNPFLPKGIGTVAGQTQGKVVADILDPAVRDPWVLGDRAKMHSMFENTTGNYRPSTHDRHMGRTGLNDMEFPSSIGGNQYNAFETATNLRANELMKRGDLPVAPGKAPDAPYQASMWVGNGEKTGVKSDPRNVDQLFSDQMAEYARAHGISESEFMRRFARRDPTLFEGLTDLTTMRADPAHKAQGRLPGF